LNKVVDFLFDDVRLPNVSATVYIDDATSNGYVINHPSNNAAYSTVYSINAGTVRHYRDNIEGYENAWTDWTPTYSAFGSMTYTGITTNVARYKLIGKTLYIELQFDGTTGGSASAGITVSLPNSASPKTTGTRTPCVIRDAGTYEIGFIEYGGADGIYFRRLAVVNYSLAANTGGSISAIIELT